MILLEALAQLSGVALVEPGDATPLRGFLAGVSRVRFLRKVGPGETIRLESTLDRRLGTAAQFQVAAFVGEEPVAKGTITVGGLGA